VLNDNRIVHYLLWGSYGNGNREKMLKEIERTPKRFGRFITKIRKGEYGVEFQNRFGQAIMPKSRKTGKRMDIKKMSAEQVMDEFFS